VIAAPGAAARTLGCVVLAGAVHAVAPPTDALRAGLALFALIGSLWMTQALHLSVTALLVPLLAVLAGLLTVPAALASFAHPVIFLFLGGFALAAALQRQGLDRALARAVLRRARGRRAVAVLLLFALTAALSLWISNTAAAAMMVPLALGLLRGAGEAPGDGQGEGPGEGQGSEVGPRERAFVLLGVAYSASIGGIGTLVGSPPNAIAAAHAGISFAQWLRIGLPAVALLLPLMVGVLYLALRPRLAGRTVLRDEPLVWTRGRRLTVGVFVFAGAGWIFAGPLARALGITTDIDSIVALAAMVALVAGGAIDWPQLERRVHWGVLLLFGGGLALGRVMESSGASRFLADALVQALHGGRGGLRRLPDRAGEQHGGGGPARAGLPRGRRRARAAGRNAGVGHRGGRFVRLHAAGGDATERHRLRHRSGTASDDDALRTGAEPGMHRRHCHRRQRGVRVIARALGHRARPVRAAAAQRLCCPRSPARSVSATSGALPTSPARTAAARSCWPTRAGPARAGLARDAALGRAGGARGSLRRQRADRLRCRGLACRSGVMIRAAPAAAAAPCAGHPC